MMCHETGASVANYERRLEDAFRFMNVHGYNAVKTGMVDSYEGCVLQDYIALIPIGWHRNQPVEPSLKRWQDYRLSIQPYFHLLV